MSLLDDVSIVVTPNGYKAGTLFGVIPVPTEGAELVTNGDFATDSDWNLDSSFSISGGLLTQNGTAGRTFQSISALEAGLGTYIKVTFTVEAISSGQFVVSCYGVLSPVVTTTGTYTFTGVTSDTTNLYVNNGGSFANGSISNISVKEYTSADMDVTRATDATRVDENGLVNYAEVIGSDVIVNGDFSEGATGWTIEAVWTISGGAASGNGASGSSQELKQAVLEVGKTYEFSYEIRNRVSGSVELMNSGLGSTFSNQVYTGIGVAASTELRFRPSSFVGDIYNVSVKEVTRDNVPRIDYTGIVKGGCPHILAEPQRTNLVTDSVDVDTYFTNQVDATVTNDYGTSPTGENNSTRVQWADSTSFIYRAESVATDTSASIFVKGTSGETVMFGFGGNVTTGDIYTFDGSWQRIIFTGSAGTTIFLSSYGGATATDFEVFGLQLEEGSYATSYIPTSGSTVTRNQDIFTRDGIGSLINSEEGVLFAELATLANDGTNGRISLSDGTTANRMLLYSAANSIKFYVGVSGESAFAFATTGVITDFNKVAISFKENDMKFYINGVLVYSNTSAATFLANSLNTLQLSDGNGQLNFNGKVKQLQVYKTALTDTQLAALTS